MLDFFVLWHEPKCSSEWDKIKKDKIPVQLELDFMLVRSKTNRIIENNPSEDTKKSNSYEHEIFCFISESEWISRETVRREEIHLSKASRIRLYNDI